jgi:hypothetical protein
MSIIETEESAPPVGADDARSRSLAPDRPPRDLQQTCRLVLATAWLIDAVLQIQPFMFRHGPNGFSGMLYESAAGNPSWIAHTITWNASIVDHHPVLTNALFATVQFCIGFGIAWRRTVRGGLALSVAWSIAVWWFGEGLGGILHGGATPFGGGPGGVLFYALLAVLLWPVSGNDETFVAARAVGEMRARAIWVFVWMSLAMLSVVGSGRSPEALRGLVAAVKSGEPGWIAHLDRFTESFMLHQGTTAAISVAFSCVALAVGIYLPQRIVRVLLGLVALVFAVIWVSIQNFGGVLAGMATDPNSGPLIILFALLYWPHKRVSNDESTQTDWAVQLTQGAAT